jgi:hypothetical protein
MTWCRCSLQCVPNERRFGTERFAMAAARAGGALRKTWRDPASTTTFVFMSTNCDSFWPARDVLLAYQGADWLPNLASPVAA